MYVFRQRSFPDASFDMLCSLIPMWRSVHLRIVTLVLPTGRERCFKCPCFWGIVPRAHLLRRRNYLRFSVTKKNSVEKEVALKSGLLVSICEGSREDSENS